MQAGDRVADRWELEDLAGSGGMSRVYRARDLSSGERVAVKVMQASTDDATARFEREARLLAELEHPSILRYLAHGTHARWLYLVTEWLDGEDLRGFLRRRRTSRDEALGIVRRVAEALAVAHRRGVVHRDIKPGNIFLLGGDPSAVKLLDFGVARLAVPRLEVTQPGTPIGTPRYMSPEQATGLRSIDARADVFSLGCVLFRMIAGQTPFTGRDAMTVLAKLVLEDAPRLGSVEPDVPPDLDALCARMLSRDPVGRPVDATAVLEELRSLGAVSDGAAEDVGRISVIGVEERQLVSIVLVRHALPAASETAAETTLGRIARRHGARLLQLADGSVVLTVSGGSVATDLASRAGRAALETRDALPTAPMALATGMSESGDVTTIGEVIDRAGDALAAGRASTGAGAPILLDDVSAALLEHRFVLDRVRDVPALLRPRDVVDAPRQLLGRPTPFVGRELEMRSLESFFRACVGQPVARAVVVTGPSGSGKTRLRHEIVERLTAGKDEVELFETAGDPLGAGSAFALAGAALRRRFGLRAGDPRPRQHAHIATVVSDVLLGEDRDRVVAFLSEMIGLPLPDRANVQLRAARQNAMLMGDQIRRAWLDYLAAVTGSRPLLLVIDDLQWGDLPSVKLLESTLSALSDRPLMIIAFARPEARAAFAGILGGPRVSELALPPLGKRSCEQIARATLGDRADDALVERLVAHCEGNPFFMEEMLRSSAEGRLSALPDTVLATLQSRLSSMESDARRILRAAAVLGPTFWAGGVSALLGARGEETGRIHEWLRHLGEQEWISIRPTSSVRNEVEWTFTQSAVRDAAYATLTEPDRRRGHAIAGEWLEAHGAADAIVLAEHFERGGMPERAVRWFVQAARQSLEGDDLDAALTRALRGLSCAEAAVTAPSVEDRGMLHLVRAEVHRYRGQNAEASEAAESAMRLLTERSAPWYFALAEAATTLGRIDARGRLLELAPVFDRPPASPDAVEAYCIAACRMSISLSHHSHHAQSDAILDAAERAAARQEAPRPQANAAIAVGRTTQAHTVSRPAAALAWARRAVSELERAGDQRNACMQTVNVGWACIGLGQYRLARDHLRRALDVATALGLADAAVMARNNLGLAMAMDGDPSLAIPVLAAGIEAAARQQNRIIEAITRCYLALALQLEGDLRAAEMECREAVLMLTGLLSVRPLGLGRLASILRAQGKLELADDVAVEAMAALREAGRVPEGETQVRLEHVYALSRRGAVAEAEAELRALRDRILAAAAEIDDPELVKSFLYAVPDHARVLELVASTPAG